MITKIIINRVASYRESVLLETDKKTNLIYGLNGTGKSTLSNFLSNQTEQRFKNCVIEGLKGNDEILVYNQSFIQENFFEPENLKGIFTLSKKNKDAETKIAIAEKAIKLVNEKKELNEKKLQKGKVDYINKREAAKNKIWQIKRKYSGGDRVLEFCLDGYKSDGLKLLSYLESLPKPPNQPTINIESIKDEVQAISGENAQKYDILNSVQFSAQQIENKILLKKEIVGNENSTVSNLINTLKNSDWVREGLKYVTEEIKNKNESCPFCQEKTISESLILNIEDYFDESYEADISLLKSYQEIYSTEIQSIASKSIFEENPKFEPFKKDFELSYSYFKKIIERNLELIENKIKSPSSPVNLESSITSLEDLNKIITSINTSINEHNSKINQKQIAFNKIKINFWDIMRWDYDQTISSLITEKMTSLKNIKIINKEITDLTNENLKQRKIIIKQQKETVNINEAILNINNGLIDLGIEDFKIKNHTENLYKIVRESNDNRIFHSLSEGEKMIISFLYFIELCRGKKDVTEAEKNKIVVIDDPISSLSHIYVFNIGRLIHNEFLRSKNYEQVFLLTHSLYFFYEMTDTNKDRRKETQKLFRIRKNSSGSKILEMKYEEIQNDYHSYWSVIKDEQQNPALIANCMRNIIEYFFNFVEKKDLNNVFQKPSMQENRFQSFCRYINRESHSLGQNIFDIKEFHFDNFRDAFRLVFIENGYEEHYKKMMK
ncbi:MAG: wobble nucleotide-excising tRNase [bacterium]|jgi:wobble nucleotide-excising tRNase